MARYAAFGTTFGPTGEAVVAQVKSISGPGIKLDTVDVTTHDSTGGWEEVVGAILRSGEVKLELVYDPSNATHSNVAHGLLGLLILKASHSFTLTFPDAVAWVLPGLVTGFEPASPHDGVLTATVTIKVSGSPTLV
jgi:predicted secreted protein